MRTSRKCRKAGRTIRTTVDCIISAIAIENNLILLHNDIDFDVIKGHPQIKTIEIQ